MRGKSSSAFVTLDGSSSHDGTGVERRPGVQLDLQPSSDAKQPSASQLVAHDLRKPCLRTPAPFDFTLRSNAAQTASATEFVVVATAACVGVAAAVPAASECAVSYQYWQPCNWTMAPSCHRCLGMRYNGRMALVRVDAELVWLRPRSTLWWPVTVCCSPACCIPSRFEWRLRWEAALFLDCRHAYRSLVTQPATTLARTM